MHQARRLIMRPAPRAVPIGKALPVLIPTGITSWLLIPDTRPIIALCAIVLSTAAAYAWSQTRMWSSRTRAIVNGASRALGWTLTGVSCAVRILALIVRATLWAASLVAFLSIVGYALGLCGDGNRHYR